MADGGWKTCTPESKCFASVRRPFVECFHSCIGFVVSPTFQSSRNSRAARYFIVFT